MSDQDKSWHIGANSGQPSYNFTPGSVGWQGARWREQQDRDAAFAAANAYRPVKKTKKVEVKAGTYTEVEPSYLPTWVSLSLMAVGGILAFAFGSNHTIANVGWITLALGILAFLHKHWQLVLSIILIVAIVSALLQHYFPHIFGR